jgi:predicted dehydrogenase
VAQRIRIGLAGVGKIARDQHVPTLAASHRFELIAAASRNGVLEGVAMFPSAEQMIASAPALQAVTLCTPPSARLAMARAAVAAGLHVMLEKPPGSTVSEVLDLARRAQSRNISLFTTWHSREAAAVEAARGWLMQRKVSAVRIAWQEDVRIWHPGQSWIWEPGGLGVFDPGINSLSIATRILPGPIVLRSATLSFPANRQAPIAAELQMSHAGVAPIDVVFDFRESGTERWNIEVDTDAGRLVLTHGGARMQINGEEVVVPPRLEYPALYERFAQLIDERVSDVDVVPLQLVADAFLCGQRVAVEAFDY